MDEKTAMNVEFLRARLLSERTVSKTARQRAEMLSQRVYCILFFNLKDQIFIFSLNFSIIYKYIYIYIYLFIYLFIFGWQVIELEEQLRIVNIQRKKAEKAAEEVLSILETQGITCISGLTDSSASRKNDELTDEEGNQCVISENVKDNKFLASSRMDRSEVGDGLSCSDVDGSASDYNCLSWKSSSNSLESQEKSKTKQSRHRQRSNFINPLKSSSRRLGKSCRKIKRPDVE